MKQTRVGIIGAGNMGQAIVRGLSDSDAWQIVVAEHAREKVRLLRRQFRVRIETIPQLTKGCSAIIICVKPQDLETILAHMRGFLMPRATVISVVAGVPTSYFLRHCGPGISVVRVMPNLPGQIGEGISAFCLGKGAGIAAQRLTRRLFAGLGETVAVSENHMDAVTALSGSGPGFIAYMIQCLIDAGRKAGLPAATAERLALRTLRGTALMLTQQDISPRTLMRRVASPGGTTEAGLAALQRRHTDRLMHEVLTASIRRARQLRRR